MKMKTLPIITAEFACVVIGIIPFLLGTFFVFAQFELEAIRFKMEAEDGK